MGYERYRIETKPTPHAFKIPNKFDVSAKKIRLAEMLVHEAFEYRFKREVVLSRPCIYGVFGGRLGGFKPIKEKCVGCMRCVQEYPHIMTVKLSDGYKSLGDSYWTPDAIFTILYESSTGKIPIKGMGYKGSFGGEGFDGIWTDMSEIVRPTRDGVYGREYISTVADIGRKPPSLDFRNPDSFAKVRTLPVPIPIIFDNVPGNAGSEDVRNAVRLAATRLNTYYVSKTPYSETTNPSQIPVLSGTETGSDLEAIRPSRIVEYDASNATGLNRGREGNPDRLVVARLGLRDNCEDAACRLVQEGVDAIHLYADYHGMDYSNPPQHISTALRTVHSRLVEEGLRDQVTIIASGGITLAEHVPKAIICGADLVALDTTLLVTLQAEFKGETRDRNGRGLVSRKIDPEWGAQRIINLMASWHDQLIEILSAMGMRDVRRLRGDIGRSMRDEELREQAFEGITWASES
jgi:hypothetical protein